MKQHLIDQVKADIQKVGENFDGIISQKVKTGQLFPCRGAGGHMQNVLIYGKCSDCENVRTINTNPNRERRIITWGGKEIEI